MSECSWRMRDVLDAGGGRGSHDVNDGDYVTVIDNDAAALELNSRADRKILGDLETYPLPASSFDAIYCRDVLEHLPRPHRALENMAAALRPGGTLTLGLPNVLSRKSLIAKMTPHRFHIWAYRRIFGDRNAGRPGYGPYKTYLRLCLRKRALRRWAGGHGLTLVSSVGARGAAFEQRALLRLLVGGSTEYEFVFKKDF